MKEKLLHEGIIVNDLRVDEFIKKREIQRQKDIRQFKSLYCFFWILFISAFFGFGVLFVFVLLGMKMMLSLFFTFMMVSCLAITLQDYLNKMRKQK